MRTILTAPSANPRGAYRKVWDAVFSNDRTSMERVRESYSVLVVTLNAEADVDIERKSSVLQLSAGSRRLDESVLTAVHSAAVSDAMLRMSDPSFEEQPIDRAYGSYDVQYRCSLIEMQHSNPSGLCGSDMSDSSDCGQMMTPQEIACIYACIGSRFNSSIEGIGWNWWAHSTPVRHAIAIAVKAAATAWVEYTDA